MRTCGIQTREFFYPLHDQPCYNNFDGILMSDSYSVSTDLFSRGVSLPSSYNLSEESQMSVINKLQQWL